jgi:hypothetical protein
MSHVTAFTSANLAHLDRAVVLRDSLKEFHPDWGLVLVLVDEIPDSEPLLAELACFDRVLLASELRGDDFRSWIFGHEVPEACTAIKGLATEYLLEQSRGAVFYLDPAMMVFASLEPAVDALARGGIALMPHILTPQKKPSAVLEIGSLKRGVFDPGFLAVSGQGSGPRFATWWKERLNDYRIEDGPTGRFTDERIVDYAPVFFPDTVIIRDPGMNVASWNLVERHISLSDSGEYLVNGGPLRLFHFSKALHDGPWTTMRWAANNIHIAELWRHYLDKLAAAGDRLPAPRWAYSDYTNQDPIPRAHRRLYREDRSLMARFPDPFAIPSHERPTG